MSSAGESLTSGRRRFNSRIKKLNQSDFKQEGFRDVPAESGFFLTKITACLGLAEQHLFWIRSASIKKCLKLKEYE
jgi:hypothetical protein